MTTSVALCTFNGEKFLKEQLDSILNQTVTIDEIIVCDDGSTDATISILNSYKEKFPEIFNIYINEENLRSVKNFEKAMLLCKNEIIFLSDQDDIWEKNKVEIILKNFNDNPNIDVISTSGFIINDESKIQDKITIWDVPFFLQERQETLDFFYIINYWGNIATGATMGIRKKILPYLTPFPLAEGFHHDEWIALIASRENKYLHINNKLIYYRIHDQQQVGGICYDNKEKKRLVNYFSQAKKDFYFYKKFLKRISIIHKRNKSIFNINNPDIKKTQQILQQDFVSIKTMMAKKYPIKSFFLFLFDKILNKRQINS